MLICVGIKHTEYLSGAAIFCSALSSQRLIDSVEHLNEQKTDYKYEVGQRHFEAALQSRNLGFGG